MAANGRKDTRRVTRYTSYVYTWKSQRTKCKQTIGIKNRLLYLACITAFFAITEAPSHVKFCKGGDPHLYTKASNWLFCDYFSN